MKMRKLFKNKKALSPVIAAIILVAVTVAVSIAVAAWMGALSFTFMNTEQVTYTSFSWGANNGDAVITIKNTGTSDLSIAAVKIDNVAAATVSETLPYLLLKGDDVAITVTNAGGFESGVSYTFTVTTSKGNSFGPYTQTAP